MGIKTYGFIPPSTSLALSSFCTFNNNNNNFNRKFNQNNANINNNYASYSTSSSPSSFNEVSNSLSSSSLSLASSPYSSSSSSLTGSLTSSSSSLNSTWSSVLYLPSLHPNLFEPTFSKKDLTNNDYLKLYQHNNFLKSTSPNDPVNNQIHNINLLNGFFNVYGNLNNNSSNSTNANNNSNNNDSNRSSVNNSQSNSDSESLSEFDLKLEKNENFSNNTGEFSFSFDEINKKVDDLISYADENKMKNKLNFDLKDITNFVNNDSQESNEKNSLEDLSSELGVGSNANIGGQSAKPKFVAPRFERKWLENQTKPYFSSRKNENMNYSHVDFNDRASSIYAAKNKQNNNDEKMKPISTSSPKQQIGLTFSNIVLNGTPKINQSNPNIHNSRRIYYCQANNSNFNNSNKSTPLSQANGELRNGFYNFNKRNKNQNYYQKNGAKYAGLSSKNLYNNNSENLSQYTSQNSFYNYHYNPANSSNTNSNQPFNQNICKYRSNLMTRPNNVTRA